MKKNIKTIAALALSLAAVAPVQSEAKIETTQEHTRTANKQEGVLKLREQRGQGMQINDTTGGIDIDFSRMFKEPSPIYDPKRPHPIQSYRSQQRAAKKRKNNR
jgi:hypothetical protein